MDFKQAVSTAYFLFKISCLNHFQLSAIQDFTKRKNDIFVNLLTGYHGKSLIFQAFIPSVLDSLTSSCSHVVIIIVKIHIFLKNAFIIGKTLRLCVRVVVFLQRQLLVISGAEVNKHHKQ